VDHILGSKLNVSINEHQMATIRLHKGMGERVSGSGNQALIKHKAILHIHAISLASG
jgi:hypothetical protein